MEELTIFLLTEARRAARDGDEPMISRCGLRGLAEAKTAKRCSEAEHTKVTGLTGACASAQVLPAGS